MRDTEVYHDGYVTANLRTEGVSMSILAELIAGAIPQLSRFGSYGAGHQVR